jgi:hypothetical protein
MIVFENPGLINMRAATTFGISVKESNHAIGEFGTGFKYAVAVILRLGGSVTMWRGVKHYRFDVKTVKVRGERIKMLTLNGKELPWTLQFGKNWAPWQAYRELYANALDEDGDIYSVSSMPTGEAGITKIMVTGADFDAQHLAKDTIFLNSKPIFSMPGLEVHRGESSVVFYRGLRAHDLKKPSLYTYNITSAMSLTEDRTLQYGFMVPHRIVRSIVESDEGELIEAVLTTNDDFFEYSFDYADASDSKVSPTFIRIASNLRSANKLRSSSAHKLFTKSIRSVHQDASDLVHAPTIVELELIDEARALLTSRVPNLPFYNVVVMNTSYDAEKASLFRNEMRLPVAAVHKGMHEIAKQMLLAISSTHAEYSSREWLADIVLTRVARLKEERAA